MPGLAPGDLADDLARIPTTAVLAMWERLATTEQGSAIALDAMGTARVGTFGLWDYLCTSGPDFRTSLETALEYMPLVGDADNSIQTSENGRLFTLQEAVAPGLPEVAGTVNLSALALFLRRAQEATGRPIVPLSVRLAHSPPRCYRRYRDFFGTSNIDFDAGRNAMTFLIDDMVAPLPGVQPGLAAPLREYADLRLAASRPLLTRHDRFRQALAAALQCDTLSLAGVARRLSMSPRSLQRHLTEHGTTWREEVDRLRHEQALALLHDTDLPLQTIAVRLGYSDARTLRRAAHRWQGKAPRDLRAAPAAHCPNTPAPGSGAPTSRSKAS
jgi:AraC-like DNA-binding protein